MNEDKMKLEEAITILEATIGEFKYLQSTLDEDERELYEHGIQIQEIKALEIVLEALENSIPKQKIEEYLAEETEKYKVYKKEVDKNENLRLQLWNHLGRKNMCEKILGIEKIATLD